jgi:hypothetical protein
MWQTVIDRVTCRKCGKSSPFHLIEATSFLAGVPRAEEIGQHCFDGLHGSRCERDCALPVYQQELNHNSSIGVANKDTNLPCGFPPEQK